MESKTFDELVKEVLNRFEYYFNNASSIEVLSMIIALNKLESKLFDLLLVKMAQEMGRISKELKKN